MLNVYMCFWAPHLSFQWLNLKEDIHEIRAPSGGMEGFFVILLCWGRMEFRICGTQIFSYLVQFSFAFISSMMMPISLQSI